MDTDDNTTQVERPYDWHRAWLDRNERERRAVDAAAAAARETRRQRELQRALGAAVQAMGIEPSAQVRDFIEVFVDEVAKDPPITVHYVQVDGYLHRGLRDFARGLAFPQERSIAVPPPKDLVAALIGLHEVGHVREPPRWQARLSFEAAAWRWAREHAPIWNQECQAAMVELLRLSAQAEKPATLKDVSPEVLQALSEVDELTSEFEYARELQRRVTQEIENERERVTARLAGRRCDNCAKAPATELHEGDRALCHRCGGTARTDSLLEKVRARRLKMRIPERVRRQVATSLKGRTCEHCRRWPASEFVDAQAVCGICAEGLRIDAQLEEQRAEARRRQTIRDQAAAAARRHEAAVLNGRTCVWCTHPAAKLHDGRALCENHAIDAHVADLRVRAAGLRARNAGGGTEPPAAA